MNYNNWDIPPKFCSMSLHWEQSVNCIPLPENDLAKCHYVILCMCSAYCADEMHRVLKHRISYFQQKVLKLESCSKSCSINFVFPRFTSVGLNQQLPEENVYTEADCDGSLVAP